MQPILETMKRHEPELTKKNFQERKYERFDKVIEVIMKIYNKYGAYCYNLYSNNGIHQPYPNFEQGKNDLENRLWSDIEKELDNILDFPSANELSSDEFDRCLQGLIDLVDCDAIYHISVIMKIITG